MAELALDDDQRHALAGHLDGVRVAQLVRRKASPYAGLAADASQLGAGGGGHPGPSARGALDDAKQRPNRQLDAHVEPGRELFEGPVVHSDLAAAAALAAPHQQRSAARVEVGLGERERLADPQPGAPQHDDQAAQPATVDPSPALRITVTISSIVGGSAG